VTTPGTTGTNSTDLTGFFASNGPPSPLSPISLAPLLQVTPTAPAQSNPNGTAAGVPAELSSPANQLPPILEGATNLPPIGPLTLADLRRVQESFILGGHNEVRPNPEATPAPNRVAAAALVATDSPPQVPAAATPAELAPPHPFHPAAVQPPAPADLDLRETPPADPAPEPSGVPDEETAVVEDGVFLRMELPALPLLAATLAAQWADHGRRLREEEEKVGRRAARSQAV